jgi:hypothetical protein
MNFIIEFQASKSTMSTMSTTIATASFSSQGSQIAEGSRAERYELSVTPQPVKLPPTTTISSPLDAMTYSFEMTVYHYTAYTITITAASCGGRSSSSSSFFLGK